MTLGIKGRGALGTVLLVQVVLAMANRLTDNPIHEVNGLLFMLLVGWHTLVNRHWYLMMAQRRFSLRGLCNAVLVAFLVVALVSLAVTGVLQSRTLFAFLGCQGALSIQQLHTTAGNWLVLLVALHLGVQWPRIWRAWRDLLPKPGWMKGFVCLRLAGIGILALSGIWCFWYKELWTKLFMVNAFDAWGSEGVTVLVLLPYLPIMGLFTLIGHVGANRLFADGAGGVKKGRQ